MAKKTLTKPNRILIIELTMYVLMPILFFGISIISKCVHIIDLMYVEIRITNT